MPDKPPEPGEGSPDGVWSQDTHIGAPRSLAELNANDGITLESGQKKAPPEGQQVSDEATGVADRRSVKELLDKGASAQERYVVDREIARGGMGAILRAVDGDIRREVALKVMLSQDAAKRPRFIEEAQITGQLEHPNIVPVHELSVDAEGRVFFTMKLVRGRSLEDVLKGMRKQPHSGGQKYSLVRLLNVLVNVCHAVAFAHSKGVIHRDLKPSNVMLGDYGEVLVMDWGLAKVLGRPEQAEAGKAERAGAAGASPAAVTDSGQVRTSRQESGTDATLDGSVIGTPVYMPPEQAEGRVGEVDERSDVYALGAILYEILTLQPPVETRGGALVVIGRVSRGEVIAPERRAPERAREGKIPRELSAIAMKALALKMGDRYRSAEEFRRDIELYLEGRAVSAKEDTFAESVVKLVRRNKTASVVAAVAFVLLSLGGAVSAWINYEARSRAERNEQAATQALDDYKAEKEAKEQAEAARRVEQRKSAPAFVEAAQRAIERNDFDDALLNVGIAADFDPALTSVSMTHAQILIVKKDYVAAMSALDRYLRNNPTDADAYRLLELCRQAQKGKAPDIEAGFGEVFMRRKEYALAATQVRSANQLLKLYRQRIDEAWKGESLRLTMVKDGKCRLDLNGAHQVMDLTPLRGMKLSFLNIYDTPVTDLSPLEGMPLEDLNIQIPQITDLRPLTGMLLRNLHMPYTRVTDIMPLLGMPLESLNLAGTKITDLMALKGMPLKTLNLDNTLVSDLTFPPFLGPAAVIGSPQQKEVQDEEEAVPSRTDRGDPEGSRTRRGVGGRGVSGARRQRGHLLPLEEGLRRHGGA
jgi:serine/threonine protein kinase